MDYFLKDNKKLISRLNYIFNDFYLWIQLFYKLLGNILILIFLIPLLLILLMFIGFNSYKAKINRCNNCGAISLGSSEFCMNCGADLEKLIKKSIR